LNPIDNAWVLLKEVTLEDLRQAARTGGLPATPERRAASRGHPGIPAATAGVEPFVRTSDGRSSGTAGQPMAERMMAAQRGRLNEFGQSLEEGPDYPAFKDLPQSMQNAIHHDEGDYDHGELPDESMPDPMTVQPPEVTASIDPDHSANLLSRLKEKKPEMAQQEPEKLQREFDFNMKQYGPRHDGGQYENRTVQNPSNYGLNEKVFARRPNKNYNLYDPFSLENRIQTQEPEEHPEFADLSRPPEGRNPAQMQQLGQQLAGFPEYPEGVEQDYDLRDEQETAQANRARSLATMSGQQSTASPMDAAMQALGNRKAEQAARVPAPVQRTPLNQQGRNRGRGRGRNSQRNRNRR